MKKHHAHTNDRQLTRTEKNYLRLAIGKINTRGFKLNGPYGLIRFEKKCSNFLMTHINLRKIHPEGLSKFFHLYPRNDREWLSHLLKNVEDLPNKLLNSTDPNQLTTIPPTHTKIFFSLIEKTLSSERVFNEFEKICKNKIPLLTRNEDQKSITIVRALNHLLTLGELKFFGFTRSPQRTNLEKVIEALKTTDDVSVLLLFDSYSQQIIQSATTPDQKNQLLNFMSSCQTLSDYYLTFYPSCRLSNEQIQKNNITTKQKQQLNDLKQTCDRLSRYLSLSQDFKSFGGTPQPFFNTVSTLLGMAMLMQPDQSFWHSVRFASFLPNILQAPAHLLHDDAHKVMQCAYSALYGDTNHSPLPETHVLAMVRDIFISTYAPGTYNMGDYPQKTYDEALNNARRQELNAYIITSFGSAVSQFVNAPTVVIDLIGQYCGYLVGPLASWPKTLEDRGAPPSKTEITNAFFRGHTFFRGHLQQTATSTDGQPSASDLVAPM